jgi:hypothetical protein
LTKRESLAAKRADRFRAAFGPPKPKATPYETDPGKLTENERQLSTGELFLGFENCGWQINRLRKVSGSSKKKKRAR